MRVTIVINQVQLRTMLVLAQDKTFCGRGVDDVKLAILIVISSLEANTGGTENVDDVG